MTDSPEKTTPLELKIEIDPDGRVVLTNLPADLVDLVHDLDPDAEIACPVEPSGDDGPEDETR